MLVRGSIRGFEFNRMVVLFMMLDGDVEIPCAISTDAMDRLDTPLKAAPSQRDNQFLRLRDQIEARAIQKFNAKELEGNPPGIVLRSIDFRR